MTDYGHDLQFGYFLIPNAGDPDGVLETAHLAILILIAPPDPDALRTIIEDAAPQVRERVATARAQAT